MSAFGLSFGPGAFRLVLAAAVVLSHMSRLEVGRPAVFIFFTLSGYWVLRMYDRKYRTTAPLAFFYLSRLLRIWLPFATAFLLVFCVARLLGQTVPPSSFWGLGLFGIASTGNDLIGTSWSLDLEMQFYLAVPLFWLALARKNSLPGGGFALGILVVVLTILGWYLQLSHGVWTFLSYLPTFAAGALLWHGRITVSRRGALVAVAAFLVIGVVAGAMPFTRPLLLKDVDGPFQEDWFGMVAVMTLLPFIAFNLGCRSGLLDMHMGNYSYAVYITHWPLIAFVRPHLLPLSLTDRLLILCLVFLVSILFYIMVDRFWEMSRQRILGFLSAREKRQPA